MRAVTITVQGRVQGVGFRYTTAQLAAKYDVVGTVRNQDDGSVFIEAVAEDQMLDLFIEDIKKGPSSFAVVSECIVQEVLPIPSFRNFRIVH